MFSNLSNDRNQGRRTGLRLILTLLTALLGICPLFAMKAEDGIRPPSGASSSDPVNAPSRAADAAAVQTVWLVDASTFSSEEKLALYAIQGIANRKGARVFIKEGASCRWMNFEYHTDRTSPVWNPDSVAKFEKQYPSIEDYWVDYFTVKGEFVFWRVTLPELIKELGAEIKGSILYVAIKTDLSPVATMAGLESAVPLTPALEERLAAQGTRLPVVFDYRGVRAAFPEGSDLRLEAHRWTMDHLLSRCSKDGAVSRDRTYGSDPHDSVRNMDLAVQNRWLTYDLNHAAAENHTEAPRFPDARNVALLRRLLGPAAASGASSAFSPTPSQLTGRDCDELSRLISKLVPPTPDATQKAVLHGLLSKVIPGNPTPRQKELLDRLSTDPAVPVNPADGTVILEKLIARITPPPINSDEQSLLEKMLSQIKPFSPVYGWGRPNEENFIRSINRCKLVGICSSVPNNSFFAALPAPPDTIFRQKGGHCREDSVIVEPKIYVAFMVNEGDSLKTANALMGDGAWIQPERGTLPINWGIDPLLIRHFPALMGYYYATMTTNDYFFAASSGWGYTHPSFLPGDSLMPYAELVKRGGELADVIAVDIWCVNHLRKNNTFYPFLKATGMKGLTDWSDEQSVQSTDFGMTIVRSNQYYTLDDPAQFAEMIVKDMKGVKPPWFLVIYGVKTGHGTPYKFAEVAKRLPADRFKVVKLDEFFAAAKKAWPEMKGRVWRPGPDAPKGAAP